MKKAGKKVFLSYAEADREPARRLANHLRDAGYEVWDPEQEILPGSHWTSVLQKGLEAAEAMVVLLSPDAVRSRWVTHEIEYALGAEHLSGRLIPVVVRPTREIPWFVDSLKIPYQPRIELQIRKLQSMLRAKGVAAPPRGAAAAKPARKTEPRATARSRTPAAQKKALGQFRARATP